MFVEWIRFIFCDFFLENIVVRIFFQFRRVSIVTFFYFCCEVISNLIVRRCVSEVQWQDDNVERKSVFDSGLLLFVTNDSKLIYIKYFIIDINSVNFYIGSERSTKKKTPVRRYLRQFTISFIRDTLREKNVLVKIQIHHKWELFNLEQFHNGKEDSNSVQVGIIFCLRFLKKFTTIYVSQPWPCFFSNYPPRFIFVDLRLVVVQNLEFISSTKGLVTSLRENSAYGKFSNDVEPSENIILVRWKKSPNRVVTRGNANVKHIRTRILSRHL